MVPTLLLEREAVTLFIKKTEEKAVPIRSPGSGSRDGRRAHDKGKRQKYYKKKVHGSFFQRFWKKGLFGPFFAAWGGEKLSARQNSLLRKKSSPAIKREKAITESRGPKRRPDGSSRQQRREKKKNDLSERLSDYFTINRRYRGEEKRRCHPLYGDGTL